jgi:hypothetical protein
VGQRNMCCIEHSETVIMKRRGSFSIQGCLSLLFSTIVAADYVLITTIGHAGSGYVVAAASV